MQLFLVLLDAPKKDTENRGVDLADVRTKQRRDNTELHSWLALIGYCVRWWQIKVWFIYTGSLLKTSSE